MGTTGIVVAVLLLLGLFYEHGQVADVRRGVKSLDTRVTRIEKENLPGRVRELEGKPLVEIHTYTITLLESEVTPEFKDWGGPDQYVVVHHNTDEIMRTDVAGNSFKMVWREYTTRFKFRSGDVVKVWLMDRDSVGQDDTIASWEVNDPKKLEYLSSGGSCIKFNVIEVD